MFASSIILAEYYKIIEAPFIEDTELGVSIAFPRFRMELLESLCDHAVLIAKKTPIINYVDGKNDIYIIGDLHGNIRDLIRILRKTKFNENDCKLLFLGDYVDRGEFSIEVITLLFALWTQFPERIILLRGNHEFASVNEIYGFQGQINNEYGECELWSKFNNVFNWLTIAAVLDNSTFCVHGGISPYLKSLDQIKNMERPIINYTESKLLADLMWSDPNTKCAFFLESFRGYGCLYGFKVISDFCETNNFDVIIRGHQCVHNGIEAFPNNHVVTVFSCSNYCNVQSNKCGVLHYGEKMEHIHLNPLFVLQRCHASFREIDRGEDEKTIAVPRKLKGHNFIQTTRLMKRRSYSPKTILSSRMKNSSASLNRSKVIRSPAPLPVLVSKPESAKPSTSKSMLSDYVHEQFEE
ncbi:Ser/Thr protein phosphatase [Tritrichomonas foetus]|uniref:Serine/threonine-protein phosphatase n=1 Tax=Tritrichomonas foetus TaxID=1144522 RepID=A0A1J4JVV1_9EUKA|nr:Ser/Thr protein phosphatase [Tritrichomonas foetus]|eukprot:OHT02834.1 Ser/Thr protein phosphatase [Tritrichomonas foetus]